MDSSHGLGIQRKKKIVRKMTEIPTIFWVKEPSTLFFSKPGSDLLRSIFFATSVVARVPLPVVILV